MKLFFSYITLIFTTFTAQSKQNNALDSLIQSIRKHPHQQAKTLLEIGRYYQFTDIDTSVYYLHKALAHARKQHDYNTQCLIQLELGWDYYLSGNNTRAIELNEQSIRLAKKKVFEKKKQQRILIWGYCIQIWPSTQRHYPATTVPCQSAGLQMTDMA